MIARLFLAAIVASPCLAHAEDALTGMYRLTRQAADIVEPDIAREFEKQGVFKKGEQLQWQIYVPESYDPERPAGVFVYIDPEGGGRMPEAWQDVFATHNMIWVGVRQTQRKPSVTRRVWQSVLGARALEKDYALNFDRLYVGGHSDTVPTAINTILTANEFAGAVFIRGSLFSPQFSPDHIQSLQRKYHVFITGTDDERKNQVRADYLRYQEAGIVNARLIFDTQRLGNYPGPEHMDEAFRFLDARLRR